MSEENYFDDTAIKRLLRLGGSKLVIEMIDSFVEKTPKRIEAAYAGEKAGDRKAVEQSAHTIKTSAGNLGTVRLQELAGKIELLSKEKKGGKILSLLHKMQETFDQAKVYLNERAKRVKATKMKKVAIVEDNQDNMILVCAILEDRYEITDYETGPEALEGFKKHRPDLILLDISLPEMDGIEVLQTIRSDNALKDIPIIALTAHAMAGDREKYLAAGFNNYITKPIVDEGILLSAIEEYL